MHIDIGDKFVAVKPMWFLNEGTIVSITSVDDDGVVSFVFGENDKNNGYMDTVTFNSHFEKLVEKEEQEFPTITKEYIEEIMEDSDFEVFTSFNKCTIVSCRLPNGFVITESSACVNSESYDKELGIDVCIDKITEKIWEFEAYRLQQYVWESENACCCENRDKCSCEEYKTEFDECLDTDLDCDDCKDLNCPYRPEH